MKSRSSLFASVALISFLVAATATTSNAMDAREHGVGNGGDGIWISGKLYLLDLAEAGLEQNPYFNPAVKPDPVILGYVRAALAGIPDAPTELVAQKLTEISRRDITEGYLLTGVLRQLQWQGVNMPLVDVHDENTPYVIDRKDLAQVALRIRNVIRIHKPLFAQLDPANRAALILHEIAYTTTSGVVCTGRRSNHCYSYADSLKAREKVGAYFQPKIATERVRTLDFYYQSVLYRASSSTRLFVSSEWGMPRELALDTPDDYFLNSLRTNFCLPRGDQKGFGPKALRLETLSRLELKSPYGNDPYAYSDTPQVRPVQYAHLHIPHGNMYLWIDASSKIYEAVDGHSPIGPFASAQACEEGVLKIVMPLREAFLNR